MSEINMPWNIEVAERDLLKAIKNNSETELLAVLKDNSFLFFELFSRKYGVQPIFREVTFGSKLRCDFTWLNDNSDGPEWFLVEIEKPRMKIFTGERKPSKELNGAIEQVKSWDRYFLENPSEKKRIFGAVSRFKFILVAGDGESWRNDFALRWRSHNNMTTNIEIRSMDTFTRAIEMIREMPHEFWNFAEYPVTLSSTKLEEYWKSYGYMDLMRKLF